MIAPEVIGFDTLFGAISCTVTTNCVFGFVDLANKVTLIGPAITFSYSSGSVVYVNPPIWKLRSSIGNSGKPKTPPTKLESPIDHCSVCNENGLLTKFHKTPSFARRESVVGLSSDK